MEFALAREGGKLGECEKEKFNSLRWPPGLLKRLLYYKGRLSLDPLLYDGKFGALYDSRPLYAGGKFSQLTACAVACMYCEGLMAKRRAGALGETLSGLGMSPGADIDGLNKFARVIAYPAYREIRRLFTDRVRVAHADETPIRVAEGAEPGSTRQAYLWALVSGDKEREQLALFCGAASRAAPEFLRMFDPGAKACALEYLICDAYAGYDCAAESFKKRFCGLLTLCGCHTHAYRRFRDEIRRMGLYKAFRAAIGRHDHRHFDENLRAWFAAHPEEPEPDSLILRFLDLSMLLSNIADMEDSVKNEDPVEILRYRREEIAPVLDAVFDTAKSIAEDPRSHITYKYDPVHDLFYGCKSEGSGWASAVCYLLNGEPKFRAFLLDGAVNISNSRAERSLRPSAVHRKTSFYFKTLCGHQAAAVLESLRMTCKLNGVNFLDYLTWLTSEVKFRCEERRIRAGISIQTFTAPPEPVGEITKEDGTKEKIRFSLFDDRYHCVTDDIPYEGLSPLDYAAGRLRRANLTLPPDEYEEDL